MASLQLKSVENFSQAVDIAGVRNQTREFMSHDQAEITYADQLDWFYNTYEPAARENRMRAFAGYVAMKPAAYGLISTRNERLWLTGAIKPDFQGQGLGRQLFDFMTRYSTGILGAPEAWLDVLQSNERAIRLYESLGFAATSINNGIIVMRIGAEDVRQG